MTLSPALARLCRCRTTAAAAPHRFVSETAGEASRASLIGLYLPKPRWRVRVATFEGDVADRAEEWRVFVSDRDTARITHTLPEARPGATLDEVGGARRSRSRRWSIGFTSMRIAASCAMSRRRPRT